MEGPTIDRLARVLAGRDSRRDWLRAAVGLAAAAAAGRTATAPALAHKGTSGATCAGSDDCVPCHDCDAGTCRKAPNGDECSGGLGACKKGRCRIAAPKLLVKPTPPCTSVSVSGLKPGTSFSIAFSSQCYGGATIASPSAPANGIGDFGTICGNCALACPETSRTSVTVKADGTSAKSGKPFTLSKVKHLACVPLTSG